jgi:hypothetical protein
VTGDSLVDLGRAGWKMWRVCNRTVRMLWKLGGSLIVDGHVVAVGTAFAVIAARSARPG